MFTFAFVRAADRLLVADPGLLRFHTALRAAIATLLSGFIAIGWSALHGAPLVAAAPAVLFSMVAPLFLRDATLRGWLTSLLALYLSTCLNFAAAAALARWPLVADAAFVALLFAGILFQGCGPRALGCALGGVVAFYLGLYLHPSLHETLLTLALSIAGPFSVIVAGRALVPTRPGAALLRAVRTVTLRAERVLDTCERDARGDRASAHAALSSMNEAALALEERLGMLDAAHAASLREALVELEIAAGQGVFDARTTQPDTRRHALRQALATLDARARHAAALSTRDSAMPRAHPRLALMQIWRKWQPLLAWMPATRTATAALLAMLAGHSLSPERWFWAVITTFVLFLGTRSRGDTLYRGAERLVGTLAGAAVSALLVTLLHGHPAALVVAMLLCVFGWSYFILNAYAPGVFFITVLVGLVYGELGFAIGPLVEMRIGEVLVGCAASLVVAMTLMPLATTRHIETRFTGVLDALTDAMGRALSAETSPVERVAASRMLDRRWHELRIALRPLQLQRVVAWQAREAAIAGPLLCCVHTLRTLLSAQRTDADVNAQTDVGTVRLVQSHLNGLRARFGLAACELPVSNAHAVDRDALAQLEGALAQLVERIEGKSAKSGWFRLSGVAGFTRRARTV